MISPVQAFRAGFYGPHIVMVFINWLDADWVDKPVSSCTRDEILLTIDNAIFTGPTFVNPVVEKVRVLRVYCLHFYTFETHSEWDMYKYEHAHTHNWYTILCKFITP